MTEYAPGTTAPDDEQAATAANPYPAMAGRELTPQDEDLLEALRDVVDPELGVNVVDLGLIYNVNFAAATAENPDDAKQDVTVDMTLTSQGCPEHVNISAQVKSRIEQLPGVANCTVNVVWSPVWTPERLSPDAKKQLGIE